MVFAQKSTTFCANMYNNLAQFCSNHTLMKLYESTTRGGLNIHGIKRIFFLPVSNMLSVKSIRLRVITQGISQNKPQ